MIKVFNENDTTFETNGEVVLNPTYAVVHKEDNGDYYLDLETQLTEETKTIPHETGTTIEINGSAQITADGNKEVEIQLLKGQTSQDSTPTPSSPVPINVVTGRNDINVCGKNLFDSSQAQIGVAWNNGSNSARAIILTKVKPNTEYTITYINKSGVDGIFAFGRENENDSTATIAINEITTTPKQITTTANTNWLGIQVNKASVSQTDIDNINIMINEGSTASTYEAYTGYTQEINLGVENLFNQDTITSIGSDGGTYSNGVITTNQVSTNPSNFVVYFTSLSLPANTYYLSMDIKRKSGSGSFTKTNDGSVNWEVVKTQTLSDTYQRYVYKHTYDSTKSLATILIQFSNSSNAVYEITNIMLSTNPSTAYTPYGTTPIELCKIGDYQDSIFYNTTDENLDLNSWYIKKEIGSVVLNGSETGWQQQKNLTNTMAFSLANCVYNSNVNNAIFKCNYFTHKTYISSYAVNLDEPYLSQFITTTVVLSINKSDLSSENVNGFKSWLSNHNTIVKYPLATPTYTEITNNELLGQLESIRLLNGLNNITITSANLTAPITLRYDYVEGGEVGLNDYIQPNKILVANTPTGNQPFRISNIEKTRRKIRLQAKHLTYDSENYVIADSNVVDKTCNQALDHLNSATDTTSPFTTTSDITTINSYRCVRKSLWEAIKVVIERWGGHLTRNNWQIGVMNSIGTDNGVVVRYAKNLKNIDVQYDWTNVVTKILPVGYDGLTLDELYLYSDTQYEIPYTKVVHFDQDVDDSPYRDEDGNLDEDAYNEALQNDLRTQALAYLEENCIPKANYELNANLEKITDIGDTIQVIDERLGINMMTSLISFDYDCILERYKTLQFGNFRKSVSDLTSYISTTSTEIADEISSVTKVTLQNELEQATSQIWGVLGDSYVIVEGDKILVVDSLPKETATNVIMINSAGIGFSNTGINGTFTSAWTIDNVLNMQNINVINLTADLIKGGSLKLGSNLNQNGILEVYDEANNLIAVLNKDGLRFNANDGGYILINTDVGFAGYDRNDTKIYWADGDEFHMKKSVVEEEITLVDKMTIIPITITDQNNNIVNDGIGFVSTL